MIVTLFGATGMVGKQLFTHCLARGWQVRAFGRNVEHLIDADARQDQWTAVKGYVLDESDVRNAITGADAVLSALGGAFDGTDKSRSLGIKNISQQMAGIGVRRIVALGGLGVLPAADGSMLLDSPDYPSQYLPVGQEHAKAYAYLEGSGLDWTFVCSPDILAGDANGRYEARAEQPGPTREISAGNLALFMVEELEARKFVHQRVGISNL